MTYTESIERTLLINRGRWVSTPHLVTKATDHGLERVPSWGTEVSEALVEISARYPIRRNGLSMVCMLAANRPRKITI